MISIGVQAPDDVQNDITTKVSFQDGFLAVTNIVFAYSTTLQTHCTNKLADPDSCACRVLRFHLRDEQPS